MLCQAGNAGPGKFGNRAGFKARGRVGSGQAPYGTGRTAVPGSALFRHARLGSHHFFGLGLGLGGRRNLGPPLDGGGGHILGEFGHGRLLFGLSYRAPRPISQ